MLSKAIYETMYERIKGKMIGCKTPYLQEFSILGFCGTLAAFAAAVLEVPEPFNMSSSFTEILGMFCRGKSDQGVLLSSRSEILIASQ